MSEHALRVEVPRKPCREHARHEFAAVQRSYALDGRPIELPALGKVMPIPEVGGLHHRYVRRGGIIQPPPAGPTSTHAQRPTRSFLLAPIHRTLPTSVRGGGAEGLKLPTALRRTNRPPVSWRVGLS